MQYNMNLWNEPFNNIKNRTKTIEMRLNDEKRQLLKLNDIIIFTNKETNEQVKCQVTNLYYYKSFEELYIHHDKILIGYKEDEIASPNDMNVFYSKDDIDKYGVLAIEVKVI